MGWLKTIGKDILAVFKWIGSPQGQTVIQTGEGVAVALGAPAAIINIANYWISKALAVESLSVAAGQQTGSGTTKAAAVLSDVTPYVLQIAKDNGLPEPTADDLAKANDALVAFLNALGSGTAAATAQTASTGIQTS